MHREDNSQTGEETKHVEISLRRVDIGGVEEEEVRQAGAREQKKATRARSRRSACGRPPTILPGWLCPRAVACHAAFRKVFTKKGSYFSKFDGRQQRTAAASSPGIGQLAAGGHVTGQRSHTGPSHPIRGREGERERGGE